MTIKTLQNLGAYALFAGAVLLAIWDVLWVVLLPIHLLETEFGSVVQDSDWIWLSVTAFCALLFLLFGFTAVYSRFAEKGGVPGLAGYVCLTVAFLFQLILVSWEIFLYPLLAATQEAVFLLNDNVLLLSFPFMVFQIMGGILLLGGMILFCFAAYKSREFSPLSVLLVLTGACMYGIGSFLSLIVAITGVIVFSVGSILWGRRLMA